MAKVGNSSPKFCIFERKISDKNKLFCYFSDRLKFCHLLFRLVAIAIQHLPVSF